MSKGSARLRRDVRDGLLSVRRVIAIVVAGGLAVAGCGSKEPDRNATDTVTRPISPATAMATATGVAAAGQSKATAADVASGTPNPVVTAVPTAATTLFETDEEPSRSQNETEGHSPVATPSAAPTVEAAMDGDGSAKSGAVGDLEPPTPTEAGIFAGQQPLSLSDPDFPPQAEDVIVIESFNVRECVMRGLLHNQSDRLFARDVVLTIESPDGSKNASWHWPLMMLPDERAPFEINISWMRNQLAATTPSGSAWMEPYDQAQGSWRKIRHTITAILSEEPDVSRSFSWNADGTEDYNLFQSFQNYFVYDDRMFESEDWYAYRYRGGRSVQLMHRAKFESIYPNDFVISNDLDPVLSEFRPYDFSDIYYTPNITPPVLKYQTPEISYQDYFDPSNDLIAENVKVFQAIIWQDMVIDVRELIPHSIVEEIDSEGNVIGRTVSQIAELKTYSSDTSIPAYVRVTAPRRIDNSLDDNRGYEGLIWIGNAGQGDPFANLIDGSKMPGSGREGRSVPRGTCDFPGGLAVQDFAIQSNSGATGQVFNIPLGYFGIFDAFEPSQESIDEVIIEDETITVIDGVIRGLVRNLSDDKFARGVTVTAVPNDSKSESASWRWPLTMQPGERAPFEIMASAGISDPGAFSLKISASLSEQVDVSRAFRVETSGNFGYVYGEGEGELYNSEKHQEEDPGDYKDYNIWFQYRNYFLRDDFEKLYLNVLTPDINTDVARFRYSELYASIVRADSHPSLDSKIDAQVIEALYAYRAIFNSNMEVVEVYELVPFTSIYSSDFPNNRRLMPVNIIPTPSVWTPKTVQLLLISPAASEEDIEIYHSSQVWIGGGS